MPICLALDVAALAEGHDHVLGGDEVLVGQLAVGIGLDARLSVVAVLALELDELVLDDDEHLARVGEQVLKLGNEPDDRLVLVLDLLALKGGEPAQLHLEDRVGLDLGEAEAAHEGGPRRVDVGRGADGGDHLVEVVEGDLQPFEDMGPLLGPRQVELASAAGSPRADNRCSARASA